MSETGDFVVGKTLEFAIRVVNLYKWLTESKKEFVLSKQLLRSGTSIGANLSEAQESISSQDFTAKVYVSLKECWETQYWLKLLYHTEYLNDTQYQSIMSDAKELGKILTSMTKKLQPQGHQTKSKQ